MTWGMIGGAAIATVGGAMLNKKSGDQTSTSKAEVDPRMQGILYGDGQNVLRPGVQAQMGIGTPDDYARMLNNEHLKKYGIDIPSDPTSQAWLQQAINDRMAQGQQVQINPASDFTTDNGILGRITGLLDKPQNPGMAAFGNTADQYLANNGGQDLNNMRSTSNELMRSLWLAPQMQSAQIGDTGNMSAAQINAPGQNDINLSPAYANMIYGNPAENPYLTGAIQKGINQSNTAFGNMMTDATRNLTQNILPSIRSGARVSGSYGGDREGIATGQALNDFSTQMGRAASQFGQNNTDAAVGAQAGAFDNGQNRALSALSGLNGNQYNVAGQNAGFQQQANEANYQGNLQKSMQQAQLNQNAALANQSAQLGTNQLNTQRQLGGLSAGSGLLGQVYGMGTNQDAYAGNKVGQVAGLLSPFTGLGGSSTQSQPLYQNTGAGILGGALMGQQLMKGFGGGGGVNGWMSNNAGVLQANPGLSYNDLGSAF